MYHEHTVQRGGMIQRGGMDRRKCPPFTASLRQPRPRGQLSARAQLTQNLIAVGPRARPRTSREGRLGVRRVPTRALARANQSGRSERGTRAYRLALQLL